MSRLGRATLVGWLLRWAGGLEYRTLTLLTFALFGLNLVVPDAIPFVDEALMGLLALLLASTKRRRERTEVGPQVTNR
jgi:hypothetical protein